ncbi:hypothetical protein DMB92_08040 [Campylobacter sp. MIT 99-7217]|uniref:hypothetical protein n=1 Tax=Campylobacter sp. MIT 99-7217 TaxID=535091 RepID=UPI00115984AD|nr:hypothetical protein [Campylobacter sp. MIT 99-7217]TQR29545.1 hypothetical protein DMB92_08040 [Campylobacter sp. MIT 99-7217]
MLIFGHSLGASYEFKKFKGVFESSSINCFFYDESLIKKALKEEIPYAVFAKNTDEVLFSNAFNAKFILISDKNLAKKASKMAEYYLFDSKILLLVDTLHKLEKAYKLGVDGVLLKSFIKE